MDAPDPLRDTSPASPGPKEAPSPELYLAHDAAAGEQQPRRPFWRRHRWLAWVLVSVLVVLAAVSIALTIAARRFEPYLRARLIQALQDRFHTKVELDSFHVSMRHGEQARFGLWAIGRGLRIWPPSHAGGDRPLETAVQSVPLIQLQEFSFHVPLRWEKVQVLKIPEVRLKGLSIHVPPKSERDKSTGFESAIQTQARAQSPAQSPAQQTQQPEPQSPQQPAMFSKIVVERVDSEQAELVIETSKPDKLPLTFSIAHLKLRHVTAGEPVQFQAELTNARPKGQIDTSGSFGPWNLDDPGQSAVSGQYTFQHADLSEFKDISGILSSTGSYKGALRNIAVQGEAIVPQFRLSQYKGSLPLHTRFRARVDGTDGDTYLDRIDATLGSSAFTTSGKVVQVKPNGRTREKPSATKVDTSTQPMQPGHLIEVNVDVPHGRIDDFLKLVSKTGTPPLTGFVETHAYLVIPPGDEPVQQRMKLDGTFKLVDSRFSSDKAQSRVEELSFRALGRPDDMKHANADSVFSQMQGSFHMAQGVITLPDLEYDVPGAKVQLHGKYALDGSLDFDGTARMQATVSQMVGGWKGFLLKPADRFFKKQGAGTLVPIRVRGTRQSPDFGVDLGRMGGGTHPQRPGDSQ